MEQKEQSPLLAIKNLSTFFYTDAGVVKAVNGVSLDILRQQTVCIVGESGCGKSITAMSIMQLIPDPPGKIVGGEIWFDGKDLLKLPQHEFQKLTGNEISMVFQEPMTSLNPVFTVGEQIMETILLHKRLPRAKARQEVLALIERVGIPRAGEIFSSYPHQLSGGMRQRIMIAMALSCTPRLLIADEPTTALDVTIQAQILSLMKTLKRETGASILLITHDLGVVAEMADYVAVMYAGKIVEQGPVLELFEHPRHPYTIGLMRSKPVFGKLEERLYSIPGQVPNPIDLEENCYYHSRCDRRVQKKCLSQFPPLCEVQPNHAVACWDETALRP